MTDKKLKVIGITGGVGSGKTELLHYISEHYACRILYADEIAAQMQEPGGKCYQELKELLGEELFLGNGEMDRALLAEKIFQNAALLQQVNELIHPAVVQEILNQISIEQEKGEKQFVFIEAALLIENGFDKICGELWYIYTDIETVARIF
jgi:dephospho-CoA kinase